MIALQNLMLYQQTNPKDTLAYFRGNGTLEEKQIKLKRGDVISFDTFFNLFSLPIWKGLCGIRRVSVSCKGSGKVQIQIIHRNTNNREKILLSKQIDLRAENPLLIDLGEVSTSAILFIRLRAVTDTTISNIIYSTSEKQKRFVKLGIGVTHHRREAEVTKSIKTLSENLSKDKAFSNLWKICIVDNSKTLSSDFPSQITIIPSENYGGTGGFMRALLHFQTDTSFTHVLFMDDDSNCKAECIKRSVRILQYTHDPTTAISGTTLLKTDPTKIVEKGAFFDFYCHPRFNGIDISDDTCLVLLDNFKVIINYGSWCYFCFPINQDLVFSFPFFVRGDDVFFGMSNKFSIVSPSGIACYIDDFAKKWSPKYAYLDLRYHIAIGLFQGKYFLTMAYFFYKSFRWILTGQSAHFKASHIAINDVFEGENFWKKNIDGKLLHQKLNKELGAELKTVKLGQLRINCPIDIYHENSRTESKCKTLLRLLCFNGFFFPKKERCCKTEMKLTLPLSVAFRYRYVICETNQDEYHLIEIKRSTQLKQLIALGRDLFHFSMKYPCLKKKYKMMFNKYTTKNFWIRIFNLTGSLS